MDEATDHYMVRDRVIRDESKYTGGKWLGGIIFSPAFTQESNYRRVQCCRGVLAQKGCLLFRD